MSRTGALLVAVALASACVEEGADIEAWADEPVPDDTVFHEVAITVRPDGQVDISEPRPITAGEQRAQNEIKAALARGETIPLAITRDNSCSTASFWYYDRPDLTGNRICFDGAGTTVLSTYLRFHLGWQMYLPWSISRGSFYSGLRTGRLFGEYARETTEGCFSVDRFTFCPLVTRCTPWGIHCNYLFDAFEPRDFYLEGPWETLTLD